MKININPVQVFPGTATRLFISDQYQGGINSTPEFNCALYAVSTTNGVETEETLKSGIIVKMTPEQWVGWLTQPDEAYIKECVLKNLELVAA